ncbi:TetR/AcrR family transcriptional regulator [Caulobacter sp. 17J65-9]|uniref:TetR family transcriptional regulator n=1 Tax=Caulobacter sp. 17J65-9 TaxID=2709382 RepID=UPI0013CCBEC3|nr:TetR/AcrR family transcriptional regulator [Caulobacter sp. 17J65-9]
MSVVLQKSARSARKPKGEGHVRRGEILEAAERIFVECGYEGATIRKIAEEVGVSSTALYMHFRDKGQILLEICEQAFERLLATNAEIDERPMDPVAKLRAMSEAYMHFGLANPNAYRLVFLTRPLEATEGAQDVAQRLGRQAYDRFAKVVAEAAATGRIKGDVDQVAQILWAGGHGLIALMITKPYFEWAAQDVLIKGMMDALFEGVLQR